MHRSTPSPPFPFTCAQTSSTPTGTRVPHSTQSCKKSSRPCETSSAWTASVVNCIKFSNPARLSSHRWNLKMESLQIKWRLWMWQFKHPYEVSPISLHVMEDDLLMCSSLFSADFKTPLQDIPHHVNGMMTYLLFTFLLDSWRCSHWRHGAGPEYTYIHIYIGGDLTTLACAHLYIRMTHY